jgi:hypothetical protein
MQSKGLDLRFYFGTKLTRERKIKSDRKEEDYVGTWQRRHYYIVY